MTRQELIDQIATAIGIQEGYFKDGSLAQRQNNPGNLRSWGKVAIKNGYCCFYSADEGWKALRSQIGKNIDRQLTLQEFFAGKPGVYGGYSPAADKNDPDHYSKFVAGKVGIPADVVLSTLIVA